MTEGPGIERATAWLEGLINFERRPDFRHARLGLGPVRALLARLGEPQRGLPVLHLAGSKGKGSTALLAEALLRATGSRVGTFTSPHLERWTERFRLDGREVDGEQLAACVDQLRPHVEALRAADPADAPTFFDATTAAALLLFREAEVDCAILEVGLGGRLDSTNAAESAVSCVTSIELEHTEKLGTTLSAIAGEKAGITRPGIPLVAGRLPDEAMAVVEGRARALGAPLARLGREFGAEVRARDADGFVLGFRDGAFELEVRVPLLGAHQARNAALALACARRLAPPLSDAALCDAARRGWREISLPGRVEVVGRAPWIIVDGAHTPASARALAEALSPLPRARTRLVLSVSAGKDLPAILSALTPDVDEVTVTRADPMRSLSPAEVAAALRTAAPRAAVRAVPNPFLAVRAAREGLGADDLLCVTGSVYLAGIGRRVLCPRARDDRAH